MPADNRYAFLVEWLDPQAQLVRQYLLFFYSIDGTVEMVRAFSPNPAALPAAGRPGASRQGFPNHQIAKNLFCLDRVAKLMGCGRGVKRSI